MDALQALLGTKPVAEITEDIAIKRLNTNFTIKALSGDDIDAIREQATKVVPVGKKKELQVDEKEVARLLVAKAVVKPDFNDADLKKHYGAVDASDCVQKALLAGEIAKLQGAIFELSGFGDEDEAVEEVKN